MNNKYLVGITISPVQRFIAESRKTQDLYNASRFLSLVSEKIIRDLGNANAEIIFPSVDKTKSKKTSGVPNRILAILKEDDKKIDKLLENIKDDSLKFIKGQGKQVLNKIFETQWKDTYVNDIFERQINNYFDILYAAVQINSNYKETYEKLENIMSALKLSKLFNQTEEKGIKCNLCGEREVLHINAFNGSIKEMRSELNITDQFLNDGVKVHFSKYEHLCAIGTLKRFIHRANVENFESGFPSTAEIALMSFITKNKDKYNSYKQFIKNFLDEKSGEVIWRFDPELCYEENITKKYFEKNFNIVIDDKDVNNIKKELKKFTGNNKLQKYYALVMLDGDHMGEWMSGKYVGKENNLQEVQSAISEKLIKFNGDIYSYFDGYKEYGTLVYAGGDDVLAFVNINKIFDVIKDIKGKYPESFVSGETKKPTCSIGVCVAHYKEPLSLVLSKARDMENKAKEIGGRNTFAIAVINKSGNYNEFIGDEGEWGWLGEIDFLVEKIINNKLSNSFIYNFLAETKLIELKAYEKFSEELFRLIVRSVIAKNSVDKEQIIKEIENNFHPYKFADKIKNALTLIAGASKLIKGGKV